MRKRFLAVLVLGIGYVALLLLGFKFVGTPAAVKLIEEDGQRLRDFDQIYSSVTLYYNRYGSLPADLQTLSLADSPSTPQRIVDPYTNKAYTYNVTGKNTFELCAEFSSTSEDFQKFGGGGYYFGYDTLQDLNYTKGYHCIKYTIKNWAGSNDSFMDQVGKKYFKVNATYELSPKPTPNNPDAPAIIEQDGFQIFVLASELFEVLGNQNEYFLLLNFTVFDQGKVCSAEPRKEACIFKSAGFILADQTNTAMRANVAGAADYLDTSTYRLEFPFSVTLGPQVQSADGSVGYFIPKSLFANPQKSATFNVSYSDYRLMVIGPAKITVTLN